jgi:hypothetical protein
MEKLRVELSNLRDDLVVIESSEILVRNAIGNQEAIMPLESVLGRNDK